MCNFLNEKVFNTVVFQCLVFEGKMNQFSLKCIKFDIGVFCDNFNKKISQFFSSNTRLIRESVKTVVKTVNASD